VAFPRRISWVNTPVLAEAIERYEQGRLSGAMKLWLQSLLECQDQPPASLRPRR
jgi:hypothetical protein